MEAAAKLAEQGIEAEVLDLRTPVPLDWDAIVKTVSKTHNAIIVSEEVKRGSFAGELSAQIGEELFDELDAPVERVCGLNKSGNTVSFEAEKVLVAIGRKANTAALDLFFHGFYNHSLEFRRISFVWYSFWHSKTPHLLDSISYCLTNGVQFISAICRESLYYTLNAAMYFTEAACSIWAKIATLRRKKPNVAGNKSHYRSSTGDIFKRFTVSRKRGSHAPL